MDKLSPEQRHKTMAAIRGKDTKPEMIEGYEARDDCAERAVE